MTELAPVETFDAFFRREYPRLVTLARALSGSRESAEDLAQDVMVALLRRWDEIARLDNPTGYARRACARSGCLLAPSSLGRDARAGPARVSSRAAAADAGWRRAGLAEVRRLPRREAQVVALYYGCDMSVADVAGVLGIADGTVKAHLSHARARLSARLGEADGSPDTDEEPW